MKCKQCKKHEAIWSYQPELGSAYRPGYHIRGFKVIKVCDDCMLELTGEDKAIVKINRKIRGVRDEIFTLKLKQEKGYNWLDIGGSGLYLHEVITLCEKHVTKLQQEVDSLIFYESEH